MVESGVRTLQKLSKRLFDSSSGYLSEIRDGLEEELTGKNLFQVIKISLEQLPFLYMSSYIHDHLHELSHYISTKLLHSDSAISSSRIYMSDIYEIPVLSDAIESASNGVIRYSPGGSAVVTVMPDYVHWGTVKGSLYSAISAVVGPLFTSFASGYMLKDSGCRKAPMRLMESIIVSSYVVRTIFGYDMNETVECVKDCLPEPYKPLSYALSYVPLAFGFMGGYGARDGVSHLMKKIRQYTSGGLESGHDVDMEIGYDSD